MKIYSIKTKKILANKTTVTQFIDDYIKEIKNNSVIVITSKVISLMQNRVARNTEDKDELIRREADYIANKRNRYGRFTTIKYNALISGSGIDESNGNGDYILLPLNPQKVAKEIYQYLSKKFKKKSFGVVITDSRSMPLRCGASGVAIGFYGFSPLRSYVGREDIFGRKLQFEKANIVDSLATAAVLIMGEGSEQTPIAIIEDLDFIKFSNLKPTKKDLDEFYLTLDEDIFHQFYKDFK